MIEVAPRPMRYCGRLGPLDICKARAVSAVRRVCKVRQRLDPDAAIDAATAKARWRNIVYTKRLSRGLMVWA